MTIIDRTEMLIPGMIITIQSGGWSAEVTLSAQDSIGPVGCLVRTVGDNAERALAGTKYVLDLMARGRDAFITLAPQSFDHLDFKTNEITHIGEAKFTFFIRAGEWSYSELMKCTQLGKMSIEYANG
jgi:hypothetical protein